MKKFLAILMMMMVAVFAFAETVEFNFSTTENVTVKQNNSQAKKAEIKVDDGGIWVYSENRMKDVASTVSVIFEDPLKVQNISCFKTIDLYYTSFRYVGSVELVFKDYKGKEKTIKVGMTSKYDGEDIIKWENPAYISNPKERKVTSVPLYPYSQADLFLTEIRFHLNEGEYNVQNIQKLAIVYDKANVTGNEFIDELEDRFGVNTKAEEERTALSEKAKADRAYKEERAKELMAE